MNYFVATLLVAIVISGSTSILSSPVGESLSVAKCPSGFPIEQCGPNEVFRCCTGCSEPTCALPKGANIQCFRCPDRCDCCDGFIRSTEGGPCVRKTECSRYTNGTRCF